MTAASSLYEGFLDYKGPKDKHFKSYFAQLLPKQLLLKDEIDSTSQLKSVYIQSGKYGEGKSNDRKKIYEFYMDGMTGRHHFKVNVMSQRKAWLEYFKIADEQVDIGIYNLQVVEAGYVCSTPTPPYMKPLSPLRVPPFLPGVPPPLRPEREDMPPPLPSGRDDIPPPLPPGMEDIPPPLPPGRDDIPPPLPPGMEDIPPPLPSGRDDVPPPLPPKREDMPPPLPSGRDDVPPPLPPEREDSGDSTIFHHAKPRHVIKVTSKSAPSSCEGQFGTRSNRESFSKSTPNHSGAATFSITKDHLHFKWCVEGVGRVKAEEMVKPERDGTFLYRINGDKHIITIKRSDKIYHHLVSQQGGKFIFRGLNNVTGTSVYNIVSNYLEHCKGKVVPYGGSIDAKKEGHEDYDRPWNPPDVKMLVSQVAKELEKKTKKKNPHAHDSLSGISGRRFSEESKPKSRASSMPVWKSSSSGPVSAPIVEDEQTDYVNEGEDVEEDEIYENTEPEEVYLNTASRDDIYKQQLSEPIVTQSPPAQRERKQKPLVNRKTVIAYQEAFKKGKRASNKFKIVLIGAEGAGKTSCAHSLLGKKFEPQQPSTVGAAVNACTADRMFATKWKQTSVDYQLQQLPKQFKHELKSCMSELSTKEPAAQISKPGGVELSRQGDVNSSKNSEETLGAQPESSESQSAMVEESIPDELITKVQEIVDTQEIHDRDVQIVMLDLGGQEIYYHVHFLFLAQEDVIFLAFDASKDLDQPVIFRQRLTRFQEKIKTRGMQTNIQTIELLMQSVYSHCGKAVDGKVYISNRIPTIILVATHSKGLSLQEQNAIATKIYQRFLGRPFMDHLPQSRNEAIFFVDNSERDPEVFEALQAVALKAAAPTIAEECPISYLQFEVEVLKESQNKAVISKQEVLAIAEKVGLQDNLMEVLNYYTLKGTLLYYPEVESLQNMVFVSPQEVSDMLSSVISTHNCEPSLANLQLACKRYDSYGLLEEDLLDDMLKSANRYEDKSTILGFLTKFHLAVEVLQDTKLAEEEEFYNTPEGSSVFLVPSMLVYNPKAVPVRQKDDIILIYYFPDKFVPENVFNRVLVNLVSWCKLQGHHVHSIFHGFGCFQFKGRAQSFKLHCCSQSYSIKCYITVHRHNLASNVLCTMLQQRQQLRRHLEECIEEAHQSQISCARSPVGYLECPLHAPEENCSPHIRLDQLTPYGEVTCPRSIDCQVVPREVYALLFTTSVTSATVAEQSNGQDYSMGQVMSSSRPTIVCSQNVPTMKQMMEKVIPRVAAEWKQLAYMLEFDISRVNIIKQKERDDPEACCCELLCEWLSTDHGIKPKTWTTLLTTLKQIKKLTNVSNEIEKDLAVQLTISKSFDYHTSSLTNISRILSQVPKLYHVMKIVIPKIASHWKEVAYSLHYDATRVKIIQEECKDDVEYCAFELFMYWLQSNEGLEPKSWETLLLVLNKIPELTAVGKSIERELTELLM